MLFLFFLGKPIYVISSTRLNPCFDILFFFISTYFSFFLIPSIAHFLLHPVLIFL